jgi:hypothetical protein
MFNNIIVDIFIYYTFHHFPNTAKKWDGPNVVPRTHAILSNIDVNIQDVKDILQTLQIGKACGDDGNHSFDKCPVRFWVFALKRIY